MGDVLGSAEVMAALLGAIVGGVIGGFVALGVEWAKVRWFSGTLRASFATEKKVDFLAQMDNPRSAWVRVLVENTKNKSLARGCRAYLTRLTWRGNDGILRTTPVGDSLLLKWSNTADATVVDIPYGVNQFVDVFKVFEQQPSLLIPETIPPKIFLPWDGGLQINFEITIVFDARSPITQRGYIQRKPGAAWHNIEISSDCSPFDLEVGHGQ